MGSDDIKKALELLNTELKHDPFLASHIQAARISNNWDHVKEYMRRNGRLNDHVRNEKTAQDQLKSVCPFYPFPETEKLQEIGGSLKLGIVNNNQDFFSINPDDLAMHLMLLGRTGTGKSWFILHAIEQLCAMTGFNIVLPDRKQYYRRAIRKIPELKVLPFDKLVFNPLQVPEWMSPRDFCFIWSKAFVSDNLLGPPTEGLLRQSIFKLYHDRGVHAGSKNYPTISELYKYLERCRTDSKNPLTFKYKEFLESACNRLEPFVYFPQFNKQIGISYDVFENDHVVVELPSHKLSSQMHNFIISLIVNTLFSKHQQFQLRGNHLRTLFIVDEASTYMTASREHTDLQWIEPGVNEIARMGREFGIGLWMCSQESKSFNYVFRANCFTKIAFPLTEGQDVRDIQSSFALSKEQKNYLYELPSNRVAVVRYARYPDPFILEVPLLSGYDEIPGDRDLEIAMADWLSEILPKPVHAPEVRLEVKAIDELPPAATENEFSFFSSKLALPKKELNAIMIVRALQRKPFLKKKELFDEIGIGSEDGEAARSWLMELGYIVSHKIGLRAGAPGEYSELKASAFNKFGGSPPPGRGGFKHKCLCNFVKEWLEADGFKTRLEGSLRGMKGAFDILATRGKEKVGYEITLSFENLLGNVRGGLGSEAKKVVIVCQNREDLEHAKGIVSKEYEEEERIEFKTVFEFSKKSK